MSNQWDDYETYNEYDEEEATPQGNPLAQLRKALREKSKSEKELLTKLSALEGQVRESTLSKVIKSRGLPDKVARIIPKDIDPSEEEVTKWLDEYGDVFGYANESRTESREQAETTAEEREVSQMNDVASKGTPLGGNAQETLKALQSKDLTEDQFMKILANGGVF